MYKEARKHAGFSLEEAAFRLHVGTRTLAKYEAGETMPPPEVVLAMSRLYQIPWLTQRYCRGNCAIGRAYSYEVLDGVHLDVQSIIISLRQEAEEALAVLADLERLVRNKNGRQDFGEREWQQFTTVFQEWLDLEHNIETLKIALGQWCDVAELVAEHNQKCVERGYVQKKKTALKAAN